MKTQLITLAALTTIASFSAVAAGPQGLHCREDHRMNKGSLRELFLTPNDGGFILQTQVVASLNSPEVVVDSWATKLECRIDDKSAVAFCQNADGHSISAKERREVYFDSVDPEAKKKSLRFIDFSLTDNGQVQKTISFSWNLCDKIGE